MGFAKKGIGLKQTTKNGKRFFEVESRPISMLVNKELTILDFESGIEVRDKHENDNNKTRYVVLAKERGEKFKFITTSFFIASILEESKNAEINGEKIFPVENVSIERVQLSGRSYTYKFTKYK